MATATQNTGRITQVIGSTFDAEFPEDSLPAIYNAVKIQSDDGDIKIDLTGEIQQHLGGGRVDERGCDDLVKIGRVNNGERLALGGDGRCEPVFYGARHVGLAELKQAGANLPSAGKVSLGYAQPEAGETVVVDSKEAFDNLLRRSP